MHSRHVIHAGLEHDVIAAGLSRPVPRGVESDQTNAATASPSTSTRESAGGRAISQKQVEERAASTRGRQCLVADHLVRDRDAHLARA